MYLKSKSENQYLIVFLLKTPYGKFIGKNPFLPMNPNLHDYLMEQKLAAVRPLFM
jgi:hypothetical protein